MKNAVELLYDFVEKNLKGENDFFKFLQCKYKSFYKGYVGIERGPFTLSIYCNKWLGPDSDEFEPGCVTEFEVEGVKGMYLISSNKPGDKKPFCRPDTPLHSYRADAAGTLLTILEKDLEQYRQIEDIA